MLKLTVSDNLTSGWRSLKLSCSKHVIDSIALANTKRQTVWLIVPMVAKLKPFIIKVESSDAH